MLLECEILPAPGGLKLSLFRLYLEQVRRRHWYPTFWWRPARSGGALHVPVAPCEEFRWRPARPVAPCEAGGALRGMGWSHRAASPRR